MIQKEKLEAIVGPGNVLQEPAILNEYARDMSFVNQVRPACVVKPTKAEDVQKIIQLANETKTALVPVSSGSRLISGAIRYLPPVAPLWWICPR